MQPEVEPSYIPRSFSVEPRIRLIVFRDCGSAILGIRKSAIEEVAAPESDARDDMLRAFRESVPVFLNRLNAVIAAIPPGGVVFVTAEMLKSPKAP